MRKNIVDTGNKQLTYEIRNIVSLAKKIQNLGQNIYWENVGDPVDKGEEIPNWMKNIIKSALDSTSSYGYCETKGVLKTREFLSERAKIEARKEIDSEHIIFFNGLGDAISKLYSLLRREVRVIGPSPAYPTHSSAEGKHAANEHITYKLDPKNSWLPDLEDLEMKIKYNDSIVAILIINPDNPTGMVYPKDYLEKIVLIAKNYDLFLVSDEIYANLVYNNSEFVSISKLCEEVPTVVMRGVSKELPWPGARCGWIEVYNKEKDENFSQFIDSLHNYKMLEVCSTTLPQVVLPEIFSNGNYETYKKTRCLEIEKRANYFYEELSSIPEIIVNKTYGAFYTSVVFRDSSLNSNQKLEINDLKILELVEKSTQNVSNDYRFVYYLLGATGVCVVPLSSFNTDLCGFRITFLEKDFEKFKEIVRILKKNILEYINS